MSITAASYDWQANLDRLSAIRTADVAQLRRNPTTAAPLQRQRASVRLAAIFAGMTANVQVQTAEKQFVAWYDEGHIPSYCRTKNQLLIETATEQSAQMTGKELCLPDWERAQLLSERIHGLGKAKSCFAITLSGGNLPCLDVHALMDIAGYDRATAEWVRGPLWSRKKHGWAHYQTLSAILFRDDARKQWAAFIPWFPSGHAPYFERLEKEIA